LALSDQEELELLRFRKSKAKAQGGDAAIDGSVPPKAATEGLGPGLTPPPVATPTERRKPAPPLEDPTFGEKVGAALYGAATGLVGSAGELEQLGANVLPEFLGLKEKDKREKLFGRETVFPTIEEAQKVLGKVRIKKPREEVSGYQTAGEIIGGFGTAIPGLFRGGVRTLLGTPTATSSKFAEAAEKIGFKLSPSQVRGDVPTPGKGATGWSEQNQTLANQLASKGTGKEVKEIDPEFIGGRLKDLGSEYDKLYKGQTFKVDQSVIGALGTILQREQELGVAGVSTVKQAAQTILYKIQRTGLRVDGEDLQRLRNALTQRARSTSSRGDSHEIYNLVDTIDHSVGVNNSAFKETLDVLRPQYRNTIILEDLYRQGGIKQGNISLERLGNLTEGKRDALRRTGQDIDTLGEMGRELGLRARWETSGRAATAGEDALGKLLGTPIDFASTLTGTKTRPARALQRAYGVNEPPVLTKALERAGMTAGAGTAAGQFQKEE
jgi:hypothetical protein